MGKARSTGKVKVMLLRAMGAIIFAVVLIIIAIAGLRWHNASMYTVMGNIAAMGAEASYETNDGIRAIEGDYLKGFHFIPERRTHPGTVVVYGGSEGSPAYDQAEAICAQGYEVIALYFWGQEGQASTLANVPLEQFNEVEAYIEGSIDHPRPITVVGSSKGAEFSAELVAHGFAIDNLVNFAPADHSYFGLDYKNSEELPSFTYQGDPVPFVSQGNADAGITALLLWDLATGYPPSYRACYETAAANADENTLIDLSGFTGNALFFAGDEDAMWQSEVAAEGLAAQSERFEAHVYSGAGHAFSPDLEGLGSGWDIMLGGTSEAGAAAYEDSTRILYERLALWHGEL